MARRRVDALLRSRLLLHNQLCCALAALETNHLDEDFGWLDFYDSSSGGHEHALSFMHFLDLQLWLESNRPKKVKQLINLKKSLHNFSPGVNLLVLVGILVIGILSFYDDVVNS